MSKTLKPGCIECANSVCDECDPKAGWIEWSGKGFLPPVDPDTEVEIQFRVAGCVCGGSACRYGIAFAGQLSWPHRNEPDDIVRYRVVNQVPGEIDPNRVSPHTKVIEAPIERALRVAAECNDQDDAEFLRSMARRMSYDGDKSESIQKHRLNEIAMRIATRTRVASNNTKPSNPKDALGVRKAPLSVVPMNVVAEMGIGMLEGASKYGRHNYRGVGVRASVYFDAAMRHLIAWWEGEDIDEESGMSHITKALTTLAVLRDAQMQGKCTDDRAPRSVPFYPQLNEKAAAIIEKHKGNEPPRHYTIEDQV